MSEAYDIYLKCYNYYLSVNWDNFKNTYDLNLGEEGKLGRKLGALPGTLLSTTSCIVRLCAALLIGGAQSIKNKDPKYIQLHTFTALREGEFALGRFISLFNDVLGCLFMGRAEFYQREYQDNLQQNMLLYSFGEIVDNIKVHQRII